MTSRLHGIALRRANRCATIGLALAVVFQAVLAAFASPAVASRGGTVVICTADGLRTIATGEGQRAPANGGHDCPACLAGHCITGLAGPTLAVRVHDDTAVAAPAAPPPSVEPRRAVLRGGLASRGPPDLFRPRH
jgi:hypothetical protein